MSDELENDRIKPESDPEQGAGLKRAIIISSVFHIAVLLFLIIGMPHISTRDFDAPPPVMVELAPISDIAQTDKAPVKAPKPEQPPEEEKE